MECKKKTKLQKEECMILLNGMQKEDFNAWYY